jgi:hypothetical protein
MERIIVNPQIHFGKPIIKGTRITVQNVLPVFRQRHEAGFGFYKNQKTILFACPLQRTYPNR